jgi:thioesterase domain-containing protein
MRTRQLASAGATQSLELGAAEHGELERRVILLCQEVLGMERLRKDQELFVLGNNPVLGKRLLDEIGKRFQVTIDILVLRDSLTATKLTDLILMKQTSAEAMCLVPIRKEGTLEPLFLVHGVGGNVLGFFNLARKFPPDRPVYAIQSQALYSKGPALIHIHDMAACYLEQIRQVQPSGPYHFVGFSFGGLVAYEMAQQLRAQGEEVALLSMLDTWLPRDMKGVQIGISFISQTVKHCLFLYSQIRDYSLWSKILFASVKLRNRAFRLAYYYSARSGRAAITQKMNNVRELNKLAGMGYQVKPYDGKITLLRAIDELENGLPLDLGWSEFARSGVEISHFPGDHGQVLAEPNVSVVGDILTRSLASSNVEVQLII